MWSRGVHVWIHVRSPSLCGAPFPHGCLETLIAPSFSVWHLLIVVTRSTLSSENSEYSTIEYEATPEPGHPSLENPEGFNLGGVCNKPQVVPFLGGLSSKLLVLLLGVTQRGRIHEGPKVGDTIRFHSMIGCLHPCVLGGGPSSLDMPFALLGLPLSLVSSSEALPWSARRLLVNSLFSEQTLERSGSSRLL